MEKNKFVIITESVNNIINRSKEINRIKHARNNLDKSKATTVSVLGSMYLMSDFESTLNRISTKQATEESHLIKAAKTLLEAIGLEDIISPKDLLLSTKDLKNGYSEIPGNDDHLYYFSLNTGEIIDGGAIKDLPDDEESREMPDIVKEAYSVVDDDTFYLTFISR